MAYDPNEWGSRLADALYHQRRWEQKRRKKRALMFLWFSLAVILGVSLALWHLKATGQL